MGNWSRLRERLQLIDAEVTIDWDELDALVGGLPPSASKHVAYWSGKRSAWGGFEARWVRVGRSVTFVRRGVGDHPASHRAEDGGPADNCARDLILVGCAKSKLPHPAPARELYTSSLFRKSRAYAERSGVPWFVLSAEHGLVDPETRLAPYELHLASTPSTYRRAWGARVLAGLRDEIGSLDGLVVEVHAGAAYVDAIEKFLVAAGAVVVAPLSELTLGQRLAWYPKADGDAGDPTTATELSVTLASLVAELGDVAGARAVDELEREQLSSPGLYSWWVDVSGARHLESGLGHPVSPGLIYAGLAGATRERSGRASGNTLWGRLHGMHLGKRHSFSTFRRSLGSVLAEQRGDNEIDEQALTTWMRAHLRVVALPVEDASTLGALETTILKTLNPPFNLAKVVKTPLRARLAELRRRHRT